MDRDSGQGPGLARALFNFFSAENTAPPENRPPSPLTYGTFQQMATGFGLWGCPSPSPGASTLPLAFPDPIEALFAPGMDLGGMFAAEEDQAPPTVVPFDLALPPLGPLEPEAGPEAEPAGGAPRPRGRPRKEGGGAALDRQREHKRNHMQRKLQAERSIPTNISALDEQVCMGGGGGGAERTW